MKTSVIALVLIAISGADLAAQRWRESERPHRLLHRGGDGCALRESKRQTGTNSGIAAPAAAPQALAAGPNVAEAVVFPDVRYAKLEGIDANLLSLDIHAPKDARDCPVLIYVHGGAWSFGDKWAIGHKAAYFTARGWLLVSVNYRLLPAVEPLEQVRDIAQAVTWIHDRIARYGGNPDELFLIGHSAGAHLASLLATDVRWLQHAGKDPSILRGVIQLDTAALDIVRLMETSADYYTRFFGDDVGLWRQASPIKHVAAGKPIPPFLLAVAGGHAVTREQVSRFAAALQRAGVRAEVYDAPHKTHTTLNRDLGLANDSVTAAVTQFLESLRAGG